MFLSHSTDLISAFNIYLQLAGKNAEKYRVPIHVSEDVLRGSGMAAVATPPKSPQMPFLFPTHWSRVSFSSLSQQPSLCWRAVSSSYQSPCCLCTWRAFLGINVFLWNLKIWYKWTYLQNRNRVTDLEIDLMVTRGKGINWNIGIDIYTLLYIK